MFKNGLSNGLRRARGGGGGQTSRVSWAGTPIRSVTGQMTPRKPAFLPDDSRDSTRELKRRRSGLS